MSTVDKMRRALEAVGDRQAPLPVAIRHVAQCLHCGTRHSYPHLRLRADPVAAMACPACDRTGSVPAVVRS